MELQSNKIRFRKRRNFGDVSNATFAFLRENYKQLGRYILINAGPVLLVAFVALSIYLSNFFSALYNPYFTTSSGLKEYLVFSFLIMLTYSVLISVIYSYIKVYMEKGIDAIDQRLLWKYIPGTILNIIVAQIIIGLLLAISVFFFVIPALYFWIATSLTYAAILFEKKSFGAAISRSFSLNNDNWWSSCGVLLTSFFVAMSLGSVFVLPPYILLFVKEFNDIQSQNFNILLLASFLIYLIAIVLMNVIPFVAMAFQYFSLVEKKEAPTLFERIADINQNDETENETVSIPDYSGMRRL